MKKLVYSIVSIISLLCLASCAQDEKLILDPDNFVASSWKQTFDDVFVLCWCLTSLISVRERNALPVM